MLQPVRGTKDLFGIEAVLYRKVVDTAYAVALRYNFQEIQTPIFEFSQVFQRTLGETSDVVSKEMYTFEDRGGESLTLRPEGTAPVVRAIISNGLTQSLPLKLFYSGAMFRYERPQKGRQRQFHQIGAELIGPKTPLADAEMIALGYEVLKALNLHSEVILNLNTLGDAESRTAYRTALVDFLQQYKNDLSSDSKDRLERNPLRILDSKDETDQKIIQSAPLFQDYLNDESKAYFNQVQRYLTDLNIPYIHNQKLVRGLDYYCHTAFEFVTTSLGAQGTVLAGGRYDGLMKQMGGPDASGIGWGSGIERLCLLLQEQATVVTASNLIIIVPTSDAEEPFAFHLAQTLRAAGLYIDIGYSGNMSKRLKKASKNNSIAAIIIGADEIASNTAQVKFLNESRQETVPLSQLADFFNTYLS
jgi:histidyl-tRNA synthetase